MKHTVKVGLAVVAAGAASGITIAVVHHPSPRPIRASNPIRVTAASRCAPTMRGFDGVKNEPDHLDRQLAPKDPIGGLICRYSGLNREGDARVKPLSLYRTVSVRENEARHLADDLDALPKPKDPNDKVYCPADFGRYDILILRYAKGPDVDIRFDRTGCRQVTNGYIGRLGFGPQFQRFEADFDRLAPL